MTVGVRSGFLGALLLISTLAEARQVQKKHPSWVQRFTAERVVTAVSPDSTYSVLKSFLESARESIKVSVYQIDNLELGAVLERAAARGVQVRLLVEGAPIPRLPEAELYIASRLARRGAQVYFYHREKGGPQRTFRYFHAKYAIVDGKRAIVGSSNYGNNGHPIETSFGNREWEIALDDPRAASAFEAAFDHDAAIAKEWVQYGANARYTVDPDFEPVVPAARKGKYVPVVGVSEAHHVQVMTVFSPDNSLSSDAILGALAAAKTSIDIEQLNFETYWGDKYYNPEPEDSPLMAAVLARARRGVSTRILLNDNSIFYRPRLELQIFGEWLDGIFEETASLISTAKRPRDNFATRDYLAKIARREGLALQVRLFDYRNCGLNVMHNKGMIVDSQTTLVSSLNWGESAMKFNREAGVLVKNPAVSRFYSRAFEYDWACSSK